MRARSWLNGAVFLELDTIVAGCTTEGAGNLTSSSLRRSPLYWISWGNGGGVVVDREFSALFAVNSRCYIKTKRGRECLSE